MGKILLWVVVIVGMLLLTRILSHHNAKIKHQARSQQPNIPHRPDASKTSEQMVRCAHCGIHLPRSEAVMSRGKTWCSREHAQLGTVEHGQ